MRTLQSLAFLILCFLAGIDFARAEDTACERLYSRIDYKQNFLLARRFGSSEIAKAKARVIELEKIKVKDIFPDVVDAPDGFKSTIKAPNMNKVRREKYQKLFDELMEERAKAGLFPRQELNAWRAWMKAAQNKNPYPSLVEKDILEFIEGGGSMAEFIDLQFMRYIRVSKQDPIRNVGDYLASYYPDVASRLKSYAIRNGRFLATWGAVLGTPVAAYAGLGAANEIINAFVAPLIDPYKKIGKEKAKETSEVIVNKATALLKVPDKYQEKIAALHDLQKSFSEGSFVTSPPQSRAKMKEGMDKFEAGYVKSLPEFHEILVSLEKNFDEKWAADLKEKFSKLNGYRNGYDVKRSTVDQLSALIESRTDAPAKPEEIERLSFWAGKLSESEDEISDAIVTWQLYRMTVGVDKVDPVMEKEYQRLYRDYMSVMDVEKLRKKLAVTMEPVITRLEAWADSTKAPAAEEKPLPSPGKIPEVAPQPPLKEPPPAETIGTPAFNSGNTP